MVTDDLESKVHLLVAFIGRIHELLLSDAFHKNVSKAASRTQSQLDDKKPHRVEDILNKWVFSLTTAPISYLDA